MLNAVRARRSLAALALVATLSALAACGDNPVNSEASSANASTVTSLTKTVSSTTTPMTVSRPLPTITLSASPTTVGMGGVSTLNWSATNADLCMAGEAWSGKLASSGSWTTGKLTHSTEFEVTCWGSGQATQSVTVSVNSPAPTIQLLATPSTVASGQATTVAWSATNAISCSASGAWSGTKSASGSQSTGPVSANSTYQLTCTGPGGQAIQSTTVSVAGAGPSISIGANPSTVNSGGGTTLNWTVTNANSCSAAGSWSGTKALQGSQSAGPLSSSGVYTLTCQGAGGTASQSTTVSVKSAAPTVSLSVGPSGVQPGGASTITWSSTGATACIGSGGWSGTLATSGTRSTGALNASANYILTCSGTGGTASASAKVSVYSPNPRVTLVATPTQLASGQSATLSWQSTNATACTASNGWSGAKSVSGSQSTGALSASKTYTLTCTGTGGEAIASTSVSVKQSETAPTLTFAANPTTVASGSSSTLTWSSTNATACTAAGGWLGSQGISGSQSTGALTSNTTYVLTCTGAGGSTTQSAAVTVTKPAPTVAISASPSTIKSGASSMISWTSSNATACTASGSWSGSRALSGSQSSGTLTANAGYVITCTGAGGSASQTATVSVSSAAPAPTVNLAATPGTVATGSTATLKWSAANATNCAASGGWSGTMPTTGSQSTGALHSKSNYVLTCSGNGGSASQATTVSVSSPAPTVNLSASPSTIASGSSSTLSWSSTNATACAASDGWSGALGANGSQSTGALTSNTTYTLTCTGAGGSATQTATVSVNAPAPAVTLSANPTTVASGATSSLTWSATNAIFCAASGGWSGVEATSGTQTTAAITTTTKYMLTCTGTGGSATQSVTVSTAAAPSITLSASPTSVSSGGSSTLNWSATNATSCTASGGWSGSLATSGSQSTGALSSSQTYTLTCTGSGGTVTQSASVSVSSSAPTLASCSNTSGPLALKVSTTRGTGISPLLVFFDATATTDSAVRANMTAFQDVTYTWNFGDNNASGTGTWAYGSNPGQNSKNAATGGVAAHLYVTPGTDTAYVVTVNAYDGVNTASCQLAVTAYDPAGANGFVANNTTCVSASGTPTPGSGGCPVGAAVLNTSSYGTALSSAIGSGKQVLFKCGDTFSGDNYTVNGTTWSIGAYGGCQGTQANRPIFKDSGNAGELLVGYTASDGRISDIDLEGSGSSAYAVWTPAGNTQINNKITLYNLYSNGNDESYGYSQGAQWGIIDSVMNGEGHIGVFVNFNENNPNTWSGNAINNVNYAAIMGNFFNGTGAPTGSSGIEVFRISACRMCVIANNTVENANNVGAVLKLHNGNTNNSSSTWSGIYTELVEISDNLFTGSSGAQLVENAPQNAGDDERLRNIVVERNLFSATTGAQGGRLLLVSAANEAVRDNAFYMNGTYSLYPAYAVQVAERGVEPAPTNVEVYNNTCYAPTNTGNPQTCVELAGVSGFAAAPNNSYVQNNLYYAPVNGTAVANQGSGNTVSNNTTTPAINPGFVDASGTFKLISDFTPTSNYSGGIAVPGYLDGLDVLWSSWNLGAIAP